VDGVLSHLPLGPAPLSKRQNRNQSPSGMRRLKAPQLHALGLVMFV
jgi:hypothetical protein